MSNPVPFPPCWAIGLMSGTSMDGIDAALIETDGEAVTAFGPALTVPFEGGFRHALRSVLGERGGEERIALVEKTLTEGHAEAVLHLMKASGMEQHDVAAVGFHGQTIAHRPDAGHTRQIGDGALLAEKVGVPVVFDFRTADVKAGGQGAPLVPIFHAALARGLPRPLAILNIGGVSNVTLLFGTSDSESQGEGLLAFDTGPGNALLDDWMFRHTGKPVDPDGQTAAAGQVDHALIARLLEHPWFSAPPPKSLDRNAFMGALTAIEGKSLEDGAATLTAFTAATVARAAALAPCQPQQWLVCGGGRNNPTMMAMLADALGVPVAPVEEVGWNGDALEAQAFAFLAVRHLRGLPQTFPSTTGCPQPMTGGRLAPVPEVTLPPVLG